MSQQQPETGIVQCPRCRGLCLVSAGADRHCLIACGDCGGAGQVAEKKAKEIAERLAALDPGQNPIADTLYNRTKARLIETRVYVMYKGLAIGECVAWNALKKAYGVGQKDADDLAWLQAWRAATGESGLMSMHAAEEVLKR